MPTDELLNYLFDGHPHLLFEPMADWLGSSRRYTDFVNTFRDKIRKKLRTTHNPESLLDLQLELETAYLLCRERALSLQYELELSKGIRGPDFAVSYTTRLTFMLEVTRVHFDAKMSMLEQLAETIPGKLGQLLPQRCNVLLVGVEPTELEADDIRAALLSVQQRAERADPTFLQRYGFRDRADFFRHYQRLSEVLVRPRHSDKPKSLIAWVNPQAKNPLPGRVRTALYRSQTE